MAEIGCCVAWASVLLDEDDPYLRRSSSFGFLPPFSDHIRLLAPSPSCSQIQPGETTLAYYKRLLAERLSRS